MPERDIVLRRRCGAFTPMTRLGEVSEGLQRITLMAFFEFSTLTIGVYGPLWHFSDTPAVTLIFIPEPE
jgi:hypothetical protein